MSSAEADPDLCVIGGSEAGLAACLAGVALGWSCVLVDDGDASGLQNPDLALAVLARAAAGPNTITDAWSALARALAQAAADRRHARFGALNVRLLRGTGRFVDSARLRVGPETIQARRFFVATGARQGSWRLADGLAPGVRLSIADLCHLRTTPPDCLVIGGGAEAVSAAQSLARLGSRVTLAADALLPDVDAELTAPLLARLRRDGVVLVAGRLSLTRSDPAGVLATLSDGTEVRASHLLLAEPGRPALDALDPAAAGLALRGDTLALDGSLRTNRRHIFAIGRAAGAHSTKEGIAQAGHAIRASIVPSPARFRPELIPTVTATVPQVGSVGSGVDAAETRIWRWSLAQTGGAALQGGAEGHVRIVTNRRGRVLQAGLVGPDIRDLMPFWTLAVARGLTLDDLGDLHVPVPSLGESARAIAVQNLGRRLASPWAKRLLRAARWLG